MGSVGSGEAGECKEWGSVGSGGVEWRRWAGVWKEEGREGGRVGGGECREWGG